MILPILLLQLVAALPDKIVTPGAVRTTDTYSVCHDYTWKYRHTTAAMKAKSYADYRAKKRAGICCEVDHLVSLQLGGADVQQNLWPQPYSPKPGAHEKDVLESYLHRLVCSGKMDLATAQYKIRTNWYKAYLEMLAAQKRGK